jgi:hypothetical protein
MDFPLIVFLIHAACPNNKKKITGGGPAFLGHDSCQSLSGSYPAFK